MSNVLADFKTVVILKGKRRESLQRVYDAAAPRSRNQINPRTGQPWTIFGVLHLSCSGNRHDWVGTFDVERPGIIGNFENDITEFIYEAATRLNLDVTCEIKHPKRKAHA